MVQFYHEFLSNLQSTRWYEFVAVVFGIASVWFSRREHILVYPVGLVSTIIYIYLSIDGDLFGEASVNLYYTIMSIYGWVLWSKKDRFERPVLHITHSSFREWMTQLVFCAFFYVVIYFSLEYARRQFSPGVLPAADAFASATAFTGMWLMARKKVESWYWWIATNIASIPLYYSKGYAFTSVFYFILLLMAISGLIAWKRKARAVETKNDPHLHKTVER